jgi:PAS domain S-box-containing protein
MKNPVVAFRSFLNTLGPVEQAQIVASTAVVVTMTTIISAMVLTGQTPRLMDFISILAVGTIGFVSVYFSLQYSRQLDEQRRQLLGLYTIAEAVSSVTELDEVLETALARISDIMRTHVGWVYLLDGNTLVLKRSRGTDLDFLEVTGSVGRSPRLWVNQPRVQRERLQEAPRLIGPELKNLGVQSWASIPLRTKDATLGTLIIGCPSYELLSLKQAELLEAFGNQISVALGNAQLFTRLRKSEQQYLDLYENAPDMYLSVNRGHTIAGCNQTGVTTLGVSREEIVGRPFESLFVPGRRESVWKHVEHMFTERQGLRNLEEQMIAGSGRHFFVNLHASLVLTTDGEISTARIVARDISERKLMEAAILHAQKIDSIGNLAGGIAHDFNNILSAILGSASIMRRRLTEKAKLYKYVEIIESSARRGSSLTRQLLTFARKTERTVRPLDVNQLILDTLQMFERSVSKDIVVTTELCREGAVVNGDDGQIQQALLNLFLNARDAMAGGGTLAVSTRVREIDGRTGNRFSSVAPGSFVEVAVRDTGAGISPSAQNRIFEPFFTTKEQGTGLGLSVVYGVVQGHGGFIDLESETGKGTTFTLFFPRVLAAVRTGRSTPRARLPRGQEHILVIEDEISVSEIARDMLSGLGYTVYTVHDGKSAVDFYRARQASIDLVLLDINMPVMSGTEAFEQLRAINPSVRIVIVTGYGTADIEQSSFSSPPNGFLQKPFQLETLATTVRGFLDRSAVQRAVS